ncbi:hypothetical protein NQD34_000907 [Periophthalmus magnuspinnatus]|nr:hypothetical protein NQD34_000907 [Periophthalmus magnuspinnatus]
MKSNPFTKLGEFCNTGKKVYCLLQQIQTGQGPGLPWPQTGSLPASPPVPLSPKSKSPPPTSHHPEHLSSILYQNDNATYISKQSDFVSHPYDNELLHLDR